MKTIKAAVFDVDGTLYDYRYQCIPSSTIESIRALKDRETLIVIASGRTKAMLNPDIIRLICPDYYVLSNGMLITDKHHLPISKTTFSKEEVSQIVDLTEKNNGAMILKYNDKNCIYFNYEEGLKLWDVGPGIDSNNTYFDKHMITHKKELPIGISIRGNLQLKQQIKNLFPIDQFKDEMGFDILKNGISKMTGLHILLKKLNISSKDIIAYGDSGNDIEMIQAAGIGVAMGNATQYLKEVADFICPCSWEDGIADSLHKLQLL